MRQLHRAGEKMLVDWAGATVKIVDRCRERYGKRQSSSPCWVPAATPAPRCMWTRLPCWVSAHTRAVEQFGGVPEVVVPGVKEPCHYEPELNPTYQEWAEHYGTVVIPARPARPPDKAKVE